MSSASIGVTKVELVRWERSCVIRSPSCSTSRISRARPALSGQPLIMSWSSFAARSEFEPPCANRSKKTRSLRTRENARARSYHPWASAGTASGTAMVWPPNVLTSEARCTISTFSCDIAYSRQPGGLEGLGSGLVELDPADLSVTQRPKGDAVSLHRDFTRSAPPSHAAHGNYRVRRSVDQLDGLEPAVLEILVAALQEGATRRMTAVDGRIRSVRFRVVELDLRMRLAQQPVDVLFAEPAQHPTHNLHVLL